MFTSCERPPPPPPTPKGVATRTRVLEAALTSFREKGYAATTLRDIANEADVSLGLTYRYFRSKEDLVVAVYEQIAEKVATHALPEGTIGARFEALMDHKLRVLGPQKDAFGALLAAAVDPSSRASVLGDSTSRVRETMRNALGALVRGATDAPDVEMADPLVIALYAAHFALLLVWVHDTTRGAKRTRELLGTMREAIGFVRPLLGMPGALAVLERMTGAIAPIFWKERSR